MMNEQLLELYWNELPTGRENAVSYGKLCEMWSRNCRTVRNILHELSSFDNGDNLILIRSSRAKGFYKTDDAEEIKAYRTECLNRGKRTFAPLRKIDRVLKPDDMQTNFYNNLKAVRLQRNMKQEEVCQYMKKFDSGFDAAMLSKMENGKCLPTPYQLAHLAALFGSTAGELVDSRFYMATV